MKIPFSKLSFAALLVATSSLMMPSLSQAAGNTCAYVFGTVDGRAVTTPALLIVVPETAADMSPLRLHVDGTNQNVVGYEVKLPGIDTASPVNQLYVPAVRQPIPSLTITIDDVAIANKTCVSFGVTTPAVPVHVPASALAVPGAVVETPEISVNTLGIKRTVGGTILTYAGHTIAIPGVDAVVPSLTAATPDRTISVVVNQQVQSARMMVLP